MRRIVWNGNGMTMLADAERQAVNTLFAVQATCTHYTAMAGLVRRDTDDHVWLDAHEIGVIVDPPDSSFDISDAKRDGWDQ